MPSNTKIENIPNLTCVTDVEYLRTIFTAQTASCFGIPFEMIAGGYSAQYSGKKSLENNRYFVSNMSSICDHLQNLLIDVYKQSFPTSKQTPRFRVTAVPRIEVANIQDLLLLADHGYVSRRGMLDIVTDLTGEVAMHSDHSLSEKKNPTPPIEPTPAKRQRVPSEK